ncbi:MAG TPA: hypothetical protein VFW09_03405 [Solirubrobacteraceae bacterium]|nr:hypothetical protein [Solirubrobacteraceae bacterium]
MKTILVPPAVHRPALAGTTLQAESLLNVEVSIVALNVASVPTILYFSTAA